MSGNWTLAIDVGTTQVRAAISDDDTPNGRILHLSQSGPSMPAGVYVASPDSIVVGDEALTRGARHPDGYLRSPRRGLGYPAVSVNGYDLDPADPISALLRHVLAQAVSDRAVTTTSSPLPTRMVLTHPDDWPVDAVRALYSAAETLGVPREQVAVVPETVAAASAFDAAGLLAGIGHGAVAVVDVGGSSTDIGIFTVPGLERQATIRDEHLGAEALETALRQWVDQQLSVTNPALLEALRRSRTEFESTALSASIRAARQALERQPAAQIRVSAAGLDESVTLTAADHASIVAAQARRIGELLDSAVTTAAVRPSVICLTGGASRARAIAGELHRRAPVVVGHNPATDVVLGALHADRAGRSSGYPAVEPRSPQPPRVTTVVLVPEPTSVDGQQPSRSRIRRRTLAFVGGALGVLAVAAGVAVLFANTSTSGADSGEQSELEDIATRWLTAYGTADKDTFNDLTCAENEAVGYIDKVEGRTFTITAIPSVTIEDGTGSVVVEYDRTLDGQTQSKTATIPFVQRSGAWNVCGDLKALKLDS